MRALTEAEARLVRAMLAAPGETEREQLEATQLPRSTYHAVRKRAYEERWLRVRFIPNPLRFGLTAATFALTRPFAESAVGLMERWSRESSNVLLWGSAQLVFAIYLHRTREEAERLASVLVEAPLRSRTFLLTTPLEPAAVPVYFDFEGSWSHLAEIPGPSRYPRALAPPFGSATSVAAPSDGTLRAALSLILRPIVADHENRPGHFLGLLGLPRPERRLLGNGSVVRRVLPDLSRLPQYHERQADQVVFIRGQLLNGATPSALLETLTERCQVFPFLLAHDERTVLIGTVGQGGRAPSPEGSSANGGRPSVLGALQSFLQHIEVDSEWVRSFVPVVDHRYDRPLAAPGSRPPPARKE